MPSDHAAHRASTSANKPLWVVAGPKAKGSLGTVQHSVPGHSSTSEQPRRRSSRSFVVYGSLGHSLQQRLARQPWFIATVTACLALALAALIPRFVMAGQQERDAVRKAGGALGAPLIEAGEAGGGAYYPPTWRPWAPSQPSALAIQWWTRGAGVAARLDTGVTSLQAATSGLPEGVEAVGTIVTLLAIVAAAGVVAGQVLQKMWLRDIGAAVGMVGLLLGIFLAPSWAYAVVGITVALAAVWVIRAGNANVSPAFFHVGYRSMLGFM